MDLGAKDTSGCTALHCVAAYVVPKSIDVALPMTFFLLQHGVRPRAIDTKGKTFMDYLKVNQCMPDSLGASCSTLLAYVRDDFKPDRFLTPLKESRRCESHVRQEKGTLNITRALVKESLPWVPDDCASFSCDELNNSPEYAGARKFLSWDRQGKVGAKAVTLVNKEQKRIFSEYNLARTWLALHVATSIPYLFDSGFEHFVPIAFMEDDYAFIEYIFAA